MSMISFISNGTAVSMDGETSISVSRSNTVASSSVMSTRTVSDELIQGALTVSVEGVVTYSKTPSQEGNPNPSQWVDLVEGAIANKERFLLFSSESYKSGKPLLKTYKDMVISDYGYTVGKFEDTIITRITFTEIFVSKAAQLTALAPVRSVSVPQISDPLEGGSGTSTETSESKSKGIFTTITDLFTSEED